MSLVSNKWKIVFAILGHFSKLEERRSRKNCYRGRCLRWKDCLKVREDWVVLKDVPESTLEKGMTEDEMVGWHHQLNGREFEQAPGDGEGQGSLACCSPRGCKESDTTERLNWPEALTVFWCPEYLYSFSPLDSWRSFSYMRTYSWW